MSSMEGTNASEMTLSEPAPGSRLRTCLFIGFATATILGLALGGWYVGDRILAPEQPSGPPASRRTPQR